MSCWWLLWYLCLQGRIIYANGDKFEGHFVNGHVEGKGKLKCTNFMSYDGEWKHSQVSRRGYTKRGVVVRYIVQNYCSKESATLTSVNHNVLSTKQWYYISSTCKHWAKPLKRGSWT